MSVTDQIGAFPRDQKLTAISIAYSNPDQVLIADQILPRSKIGVEEFSWVQYPKGQGFTVPDTRVGAKGKLPQVEISGAKVTSSVEDEGLQLPLTNKDIAAAPEGVDPRMLGTELVTKLVLLRREIRCAALVTDATQYSAANVKDFAALDAGAHKWSSEDADPLGDLKGYLNAMLMRGNLLAMGSDAWDALSKHPKVVSAALGNAGQYGFASKQRVCELLEVNDILVGTAWVNANKPGQAVTLTRTWGNSCVGFYRDSTASFQTQALTFGLTAQYGDRMAGTKEIEPGDMGIRGGISLMVAESVKELIVAPDCGILLQNLI